MTGRRGNGEGSITRRKDGLHMARYTVKTETGSKRMTEYAKTRKEAAEKLTRAMADRDCGLFVDSENMTLSEYMSRWLNDSVKGSVKPKTFESYKWLVRKHIAPALGRVKVRAISPVHLQGFYRSKLEAGLSPRSVQYLHAVLHRALKQALRWGLVPRNAAEAVDPPKPQKKEIKPLSRDEARRLLEAAHADRLEALYVLAVHCGLRQGELLGLRWGDVDLEAGTLQVHRSLTVTKDGPAFAAPKTAKSRRSVKLTIRATEALRGHLQRQVAEIERMGDLYRDDGLIFSTTVGTPINPRNLTGRSFKPCWSALDCRRVSGFTTSGTPPQPSCWAGACIRSWCKSSWGTPP
jgi:integrase